MAKVRTTDVLKNLDLELVSGEDGLHRPITTSDLHRPGLELAGFLDYYPKERVQLLGRTELRFFEKLPQAERIERMERLCDDETPAIVISRDLDIPEELIESSERHAVPVMRSNLTTTRLFSKLTAYLEKMLAPTTAVHGVLLEVYGVGVLLTGKSGVGKSEAALDLVKRGHRLIADDCVEIRQEENDTLVGTAPELIEHLLEIRGLGIINVMTLFGAGAIRGSKQITLNVHLELWNSKKQYDRLGIEDEKIKIIDTEVTKVTVPVRPGRNLAVIIEVAAMNHRLKRFGINTAQQFTNKLENVIKSEPDSNTDYL
ncbi:HPr(Ser) kinase/phosphatase [Bacillus thermotolerans]|uniref:HPr kinase/phosphorylase n=1 Tax=Bacillus thermotolerans TaxID=1221996 RepID=A0A0F5I7H6_BACTR|nr:HPr(Ser) kinase/phosphatase [Bacillus thermotolerans]KKB38679.1 HPr kinase/phosphorylase [Bacillus thermotolerans]KKB41418.1 HPr kinase/phosphorylase [Bacillus thermotolerans]KKB43969.1 HPr kinase/phosphorylase [Bacillus thermotolerans]